MPGMVCRGRVAGRTILVVEDDPGLREVYSDVFRDDGWVVHAAADGLEALALLNDGVEPCVAVVDLRMPTMDGWTFIRELQGGRWRTLPFVVMAAHYQIQEEARLLGARWWLQKPVGIDRLLDVVDRACTTEASTR
jgi:CheY-like chemotaxis protein